MTRLRLWLIRRLAGNNIAVAMNLDIGFEDTIIGTRNLPAVIGDLRIEARGFVGNRWGEIIRAREERDAVLKANRQDAADAIKRADKWRGHGPSQVPESARDLVNTAMDINAAAAWSSLSNRPAIVPDPHYAQPGPPGKVWNPKTFTWDH
jgi:hypothetical protein